MKQNILKRTLLVAALAVSMGCADDSDDNDPGFERPSGTNGWSEVSVAGESSVRGPHCDSPITFRALSDGRFTKTCGSVGQTLSGLLSEQELTSLDTDAGKVAAGELSQEECTRGSPVTYFMEMIMDDGAKTRLIDVRDIENETCWRGSRADVTKLRNNILSLVAKYRMPAPTSTTMPPGATTPSTTTTTTTQPPTTTTVTIPTTTTAP